MRISDWSSDVCSSDLDVVGDLAGYISDGLDDCYVQVIDELPVAVQLPASVVLQVVDTAPELKGATATKRPKPATLNTGIEIMVPEYVSNGEKSWELGRGSCRERVGQYV